MDDYIPALMELAEQFSKDLKGTHLRCAIVWDGQGFRLYKEDRKQYKKLVRDDARMLSCLVGIYTDPSIHPDSLYDDMCCFRGQLWQHGS